MYLGMVLMSRMLRIIAILVSLLEDLLVFGAEFLLCLKMESAKQCILTMTFLLALTSGMVVDGY